MSRAAVVAVAVLCAAVLAWWAMPGSAENEPTSRAGFSVAGDGHLPTSRPDLRDARDPLSADEIGYAMGVATNDPALPASATDGRGEPGWEVLAVDVPDNTVDSDGRRAVVTLYDYASDTTYFQVVDLTRGRVASSRAATHLQQPPSANETETAMSIALAAEPPLAFTTDFEASEGVPLVSAEQITTVAGVWTPGDPEHHHGHAEKDHHHGQECARQRCVRLIVSTPAGLYLNTTDFVVNLSERAVVRLAEAH